MCEYPHISSTSAHSPPSLNVPPHTRLNIRSSSIVVLRVPHGHCWTMGVGFMSDSAHNTPVLLKLYLSTGQPSEGGNSKSLRGHNLLRTSDFSNYESTV